MGGDESKPDPKVQQEQGRLAEKKRAEDRRINDGIKAEKVTSNLDTHIQQFDNKVKKYEAKIDLMKTKAKEFIADGKEKEAKKILQEATRLKKQLEVNFL